MQFVPQLPKFVAIVGVVTLAGCSCLDLHSARSCASGTHSKTAQPAASSPLAFHDVPDTILAWDAKLKTYRAKPGDDSALFVFNVTNVSPAEVVIETTATSCGCTVAEL